MIENKFPMSKNAEVHPHLKKGVVALIFSGILLIVILVGYIISSQSEQIDINTNANMSNQVDKQAMINTLRESQTQITDTEKAQIIEKLRTSNVSLDDAEKAVLIQSLK